MKCSSTPFKQRLEIGARALRLAPRGFRGIAEAEISVDQASALIVPCGGACGGKRVGIGLAIVAQGIEPRRANHRGRKPRKIFGAQRRNGQCGPAQMRSRSFYLRNPDNRIL